MKRLIIAWALCLLCVAQVAAVVPSNSWKFQNRTTKQTIVSGSIRWYRADQDTTATSNQLNFYLKKIFQTVDPCSCWTNSSAMANGDSIRSGFFDAYWRNGGQRTLIKWHEWIDGTKVGWGQVDGNSIQSSIFNSTLINRVFVNGSIGWSKIWVQNTPGVGDTFVVVKNGAVYLRHGDGNTGGGGGIGADTAWVNTNFLRKDETNVITPQMLTDDCIPEEKIDDGAVGLSKLLTPETPAAGDSVLRQRVGGLGWTRYAVIDSSDVQNGISITPSKLRVQNTPTAADTALYVVNGKFYLHEPTGGVGGSGDVTGVSAGTGISVANGGGPVPTVSFDQTYGDSRYVNSGEARPTFGTASSQMGGIDLYTGEGNSVKNTILPSLTPSGTPADHTFHIPYNTGIAGDVLTREDATHTSFQGYLNLSDYFTNQNDVDLALAGTTKTIRLWGKICPETSSGVAQMVAGSDTCGVIISWVTQGMTVFANWCSSGSGSMPTLQGGPIFIYVRNGRISFRDTLGYKPASPRSIAYWVITP